MSATATGSANPPTLSVFGVSGMCCLEEAGLLEKRLRAVGGVTEVHADVLGARLRVAHDPHLVTPSTIAENVAAVGMRAWLLDDPERPSPDVQHDVRLRTALLASSAVLLAAGVAASAADLARSVVIALLAGSVVTGGVFTARRALAALRARALDINVLMVVAVVGAGLLGDWFEAATVVLLFALSQWLEAKSLDRARRAIGDLVARTPDDVTVVRKGRDATVRVDQVAVGETMIVRPGERLALDGEVAAGYSFVNQAPVTGESVPVTRGPGDRVFAGSINGDGTLEVRVTRLKRDSTLSRIVHLVEQAQATRAPAQAFVDRFARVYTPAVLVLGAAVATVPPLAFGADWEAWIYRGLVLIVVSCPCAFVISTPVAIVSALAAAARRGVLIKGGLHLERAGAIRCVALDKTGTLTRGELEVRDVVSLNGDHPSEVIRVAAAVEARSEHPIGRAIVRHAAREGLTADAAAAFTAIPGRGAEADVDGRRVVLGNHRLFEERALCTDDLHERLDELTRRGRTAVVVAREDRPVGVLGVADEIRTTGRDAVLRLREHGIEHVVLLTGDSAPAARAIAAEAGVDEVIAELLPEDKVHAVQDLRRRYGAVAMVGDGINDAPALAAADLGFAMATAGTAAALETADVALMSDELLKVPYALALSRRTTRIIKANVAIALGLKFAFVALAVSGVATLWMAVVADTGASIVVVANSLRLLRE